MSCTQLATWNELNGNRSKPFPSQKHTRIWKLQNHTAGMNIGPWVSKPCVGCGFSVQTLVSKIWNQKNNNFFPNDSKAEPNSNHLQGKFFVQPVIKQLFLLVLVSVYKRHVLPILREKVWNESQRDLMSFSCRAHSVSLFFHWCSLYFLMYSLNILIP